MEMQTALLIFIVIFALAIGFFLGLFLVSLDAPFLRKLFQKEGADESSETSEVEPIAVEEGKAIPIKKPTPESELVLKVWKEEGNTPVYEVGGKYIAKENLPEDVLNIITIHEEKSPEAPVAPPAPEIEIDPASIKEIEDDDEAEIKMLSVVDEVNDILQRKLHGSALAGKGIHLMENHKQEIRFWVGLESYDDVEEIPDPEIRQLIDEAVREWEQSRE